MDRKRITISDPISPTRTNVIEVEIGDHLLNLAHAIAKEAYGQTLNLSDLIKPGYKLCVEVSVIT